MEGRTRLRMPDWLWVSIGLSLVVLGAHHGLPSGASSHELPGHAVAEDWLLGPHGHPRVALGDASRPERFRPAPPPSSLPLDHQVDEPGAPPWGCRHNVIDDFGISAVRRSIPVRAPPV